MPTYPPPPCMAAQMGVPGNPECQCPTPMAAMFCMSGHMTECHAGQGCAEARCSHLSRYSDGEDDSER